MQREEFIVAWNKRRSRQMLISVLAPVFIATIAVIVMPHEVGTPTPMWKRLILIGSLVGFIGCIVGSISNARCPSCGALKGSGIFFKPRCSACNMP